MAEINVLGLAVGVFLALVVAVMHFSRGVGWDAGDNIAQEVLERRAETVPETDFPEPMNRAPGGGSAPAIPGGAGAEGDAGGELEEAAEEEPSPAEIPDDEAESYEIEFVKEEQTFEVPENKTILEFGEEQGYDLPYACREGQCLSCAGHIADGDAQDFIRHDGNEMLDENEMGEGYCLTCVAYPTASFTLETSESP